MFISTSELEKIKSQIAFLQDLASKFQSELIALKYPKPSKAPAKAVKKKTNARTAKSRAMQSEKMKAYWAARKANEAAA